MLKRISSLFSRPRERTLKLIPHFTMADMSHVMRVAAEEKAWVEKSPWRLAKSTEGGHRGSIDDFTNYQHLTCAHMFLDDSTVHLLLAAFGGSDVAAWQLVKERKSTLKRSILALSSTKKCETYLERLHDVVENLAARDSRFLMELFREAKEEKNMAKRAKAWQIACAGVEEPCDPSYEAVWAAESIFFDDHAKYVDIMLAAARRGDSRAWRYLKQWKENGTGAVLAQERFDEVAGTEEVARFVEKAEKVELDEDLREYFADNCARLFWVNSADGARRNEMLEERTQLFEKLMGSSRLSEEKKRELLELGVERKIPAAMCWKGKELEEKGKMKEALDMFVRSVQIGGPSVPYAMTKVAHACWSQSSDLWSYDLPKTLIGSWRHWPEETKKMQRYDDLVIAKNDVELCRRMGIPVVPDLEQWAACGDKEAAWRLEQITPKPTILKELRDSCGKL